MTRRMQANPTWSPGHHQPEHDENEFCSSSPACIPIEEKPVPNLTNAVSALPAHGTDALTLKGRVLALVAGTVGVPNTGTYVVADGVVHKAAARYVKERLQPGGRLWKWTLEAEEPRAPFFEEGKTYLWAKTKDQFGRRCTFKVDTVKDNPAGGKTAFGLQDSLMSGAIWVTVSSLDGWEEVR
ncbi:hypothetical protein [Streptomyces hydrogenans]|uniref:Uncharacterized protein n=1 Tax=Streptomyces hydrogenans TaxID=1873719 RepID=A0ABQ3PJM0_9ACTN|nr:hypothetical protein [Streptomyces hydrogenans]GHG10114.1 hypothetical protein GCM10018784_23500 [Streptomyces hydrogenans]GHI25198.1 hypothetical protein Shyd_65690 [Streptomyces hydrogenans]